MIQIGVIGYGTIGEDVVQAIRQGNEGKIQVTSILVRDRSKYQAPEDIAALMTEDESDFFENDFCYCRGERRASSGKTVW